MYKYDVSIGLEELYDIVEVTEMCSYSNLSHMQLSTSGVQLLRDDSHERCISRADELTQVMRERLSSFGCEVTGFGHLGDGNLHLNIYTPGIYEKAR